MDERPPHAELPTRVSSSEKTLEASDRRRIVVKRYQALVAAQEQAADKVFIGGNELKHLDRNLVTLDDDANEHPRTWVKSKKIQTTAIVAAFCFLSPFASTIFAPSVHIIAEELEITDSSLAALQVSIFLFAYAIGPLFLAPLSESYGRAIILHVGNWLFVAFSIGGGFAKTAAQLAVCRFLAGLFGSSGLAVVGGVATDIWDIKARAKATGIIMIGPILGPILGPVCGGWMSARASWRWTLWVPAIVSGILCVVALFTLPECYAPRVLELKVKKVKLQRADAEIYSVLDFEPRNRTLGSTVNRFARPVTLLFLDPALFLVSLFYSVLFGIVYLIVVTFADVFGLGYHHSVGIVGTDFLTLGIGMIIGTIGTVKAMEKIFRRKKYKPETRLLSCIVGLVLTAGGLFMYGFSALRTHWIVPLVGLAIFATGVMNIMMSIQLYAVEGFSFPASAFAAISFLRCLFAGAFPLFGAKLFARLGLNWGVALLAFLSIAIGLPFIPLLYIFGPRLRKTGSANIASFEGSSNPKGQTVEG